MSALGVFNGNYILPHNALHRPLRGLDHNSLFLLAGASRDDGLDHVRLHRAVTGCGSGTPMMRDVRRPGGFIRVTS